jgi:1-deoxy-D-xylulose-5-phosphate reductoisomerase
MKNPKILVFGATGVLGKKLIKFLYKKNIFVNCAIAHKNFKQLKQIQLKYKVKNNFCLSFENDQASIKKIILSNSFDIIYFLDNGINSLPFLLLSLKKNNNSHYCIANKELIITGGNKLIHLIKKHNFFIPLDSEHFSMFDYLNYDNTKINKIYITASGGPFYFKKNINFINAQLSNVINHPKWKMGEEISINSSNFVNKILEMIELSIIYDIPMKNIDFLISKQAKVHSIISMNDGRYIFNIFNNNMLIPLLKPFENFNFNFSKKIDLENYKDFKVEFRSDKRFKIFKKINTIKNFNHKKRILFLLLNKKAHDLYKLKLINYNFIVNFIFNNLDKFNYQYKLSNFDDIIRYYDHTKSKIEQKFS